ncbi:MAG: type I-C CRISPR-associated protein Cas8c/Csd1 [bacterium]|jgi:CRISPR-associated protein Csd1|nr:type I-C CRISPR-associated protein Cas8c/Csd1 [bacterium]
MILQALYEYYQRKAADPESNIAPRGYEWKEIPFLIVIDENGCFINLEDTRIGEGKNKRAKRFLVIKSKGRSGSKGWQVTNILWDHYGYVLSHPKEETDKAIKDAQNQHGVFKELIKEVVKKHPENAQFKAVENFFSKNDEKGKAFAHPSWADCSKIAGCNLSFRVVGEINIVAEHKDLQEYAFSENTDNSEDSVAGDQSGVCLITGIKDLIAVTHSATSVPGGKSGGKLVGLQRNSGYDSYNKEQGLNAPVSRVAEDAYTTALNVLLGKDSQNKFRVADTTTLFWSEKKTDFENHIPWFFDPPRDNPDEGSQKVKTAFESLYSGKFEDENDTDFYILGLAPNAARISVRFWKKDTVKNIAEKIKQHFDDLAIVHSEKDSEYLSLNSLLRSIVLEYKMDNVPPNMAGAVVESILDGRPYPVTFLNQCVRRIRAEQHVTHKRAAILKSYINRYNRSYKPNEKEIAMSLDKENKNPAYRLGRLFAVLEKIQEDAQPGINATIRDRYYSAASSSPATVFPVLLKLKNHHLAKMENQGWKVNHEKQIGEIMEGLDPKIPSHLPLPEQGYFAVGYYHQRQEFFKKKDNNN